MTFMSKNVADRPDVWQGDFGADFFDIVGKSAAGLG